MSIFNRADFRACAAEGRGEWEFAGLFHAEQMGE